MYNYVQVNNRIHIFQCWRHDEDRCKKVINELLFLITITY